MNHQKSFLNLLQIFAKTVTGSQNSFLVFFEELKLLKNKTYIFKLKNGLKFRVRGKTSDLKEVVIVNLIDEYPTKFLLEIPQNTQVLDLGAHIGSFSIMLAKLRPDLSIYSIEPSLANNTLLKQNISTNFSNPNIACYKYIISSVDGPMTLNTEGEPDSWHVDKNVVDKKNEIVASKKLSTLLSEEKISNLSFIKMDVEGAEYEILSGSKDLIKSLHSIILEYHDADGIQPHSFFKDYFQSINFDILLENDHIVYAKNQSVK